MDGAFLYHVVLYLLWIFSFFGQLNVALDVHIAECGTFWDTFIGFYPSKTKYSLTFVAKYHILPCNECCITGRFYKIYQWN